MNVHSPIASELREPSVRRQQPPPVYAGEALLLTWGHSANRGMTVAISLRSVHDLGTHPFKGMAWGPGGQRLRIAVVKAAAEDAESAPEPVYEGEAMLMRWADDCALGMMIRLLIDKGPDGTRGLHPFDGLHAGPKDGAVLTLAAWAVADDERVLDPRFMPRKRPFHTLDPTQQTQILCRDARFAAWTRKNLPQLLDEPDLRFGLENLAGYEFASEVVRRYCGVTSRSELKSDTAAGERARGRMRQLMRGYDEAVWGSAAVR